jgi:hypothetical protein
MTMIIRLLSQDGEFVCNLTISTSHSAGSYGMGVLLDEKGEIFDSGSQILFDHHIETDSPEAVRQALGLAEIPTWIVTI